MTVTSTPPGIPSPARLEKWLGDTLAAEPAELTDIQLIAGGRSKLTYRLAVAGPGGDRMLVPRRPPLLAAIHGIDVEAAGLGGLGRGAGASTGPGAPLTPGRGPAPRSRRACRSASACRAFEVRRPAYAGPLHKTTRYPRPRFTPGAVKNP
jgi:hypothetical protein